MRCRRSRSRGGRRSPSSRNGAGGPFVYLHIESGDDMVTGCEWPRAVLLASGPDPYALVDFAVPEAAALSGGALPLKLKRLPPSIDVFGWCSWDAYYSSVSAQGLTDAVKSLSQGGVPPKLVIIDDGWQCTDLDEEFKGFEDPASRVRDLLERARHLSSLDEEKQKSAIHLRESIRELAREALIEGESEMLSAVLRDIPEGTSTGRLLQEIKGADDETLQSVDYHTIAQQHDARALKALVGVLEEEGEEGRAAARAPDASPYTRKRRPRGNLVYRASQAIGQYILGLVVGGFQALILIFYQWVVDPAAYGTWPVSLFAYLTAGPLRKPMLQFYADQTNFTRRLVDVKANAKFHSPDATADAIGCGKQEALASVISHLKQNLEVRFVYCWHGLSAYWSGVHPDAPGTKKYGARIVYARPPASLKEVEPSMAWNPSVLAGLGAVHDPAPLFRDMHSYLAGAGATGVKVDCQAGVGMIGSVTGGGPALAARYHTALEDSVATHFPDNDAINCMCHSTENIYRWRNTAVARASDDFYPTDTASHTPHIAACAYNGLFISALALPDFDMFHSKHRVAELHAAARAVSGGPVYVSDAPGNHGFELLRRLVLPDGSVFRAQLPGRPTRDCLFADVLRDGQSVLKIWNVNECTGVVGAFHLQGASWCRTRRRFVSSDFAKELTTTVRVTDIEVSPFREATSPQSAYVAYVNATGRLHRLRGDDGVEVSLKPAHAAVVTFGKVYETMGIEFAAIGLSNMLNGGGAVSSVKCRQGEVAGMIEVGLKGGGQFLAYSSARPESCSLDGAEVEFRWNEEDMALELDVPFQTDASGNPGAAVHEVAIEYAKPSIQS